MFPDNKSKEIYWFNFAMNRKFSPKCSSSRGEGRKIQHKTNLVL